MNLRKLLDKLHIDVVQSNRSWSQFFALGGILKSSTQCGKVFADANELNRHKDFCEKERST